jgi:glycosyltransferase involved in cell wall biosynthesis
VGAPQGQPRSGIAGVTAVRELPSPASISVICPTYNRHNRHEGLYTAFQIQNHPDKDLWILDDSPSPSPFFRDKLGSKDPRVHYIHTGERLTIGDKRNRLIAMSSGSVIAHFDDDDWYAPFYLSSMVAALVSSDADFVKCSVWKERREKDNHRRVLDARQNRHANLWGYGFSYMYRRFATTRASFPLTNQSEDYIFLQALRAAGLKAELVEHCADLVEHLLHGRNTSRKD